MNLDTLEPEQASKERSDVWRRACGRRRGGGRGGLRPRERLSWKSSGCDSMADIRAAIKSYKQRLWTVSH